MLTFLDVSKWQESINWQLVADHQIEGQYIRGAIARATVADQTIDPMLRANLDGIQATGRLWPGAYHNLINDSVTAQVGRFVAAIPDWKGIIPMVDCEQGATWVQLHHFINLIEVELGVRPLVYLPRWYWEGMQGAEPLPPEWTWVHSDFPPWGTPLIPPLTSLEGHVWQYTSSGVVPGINARVDLNRYYGNEEVLLRLAVQ
jgi:GH25 family lysozyme M1 (1,4-beta-N-acetylmuramidase)